MNICVHIYIMYTYIYYVYILFTPVATAPIDLVKTRIQVYTHIHTRTRVYRYIRIYIHAHTCTCKRIQVYTHIHTRTRVYMPPPLPSILLKHLYRAPLPSTWGLFFFYTRALLPSIEGSFSSILGLFCLQQEGSTFMEGICSFYRKGSFPCVFRD
jgi:hypothetical protein